MLRHARALRSCIHSPADAWLAARMAAWATVLPALKHALPLPRLVGLMRATPRRPLRQPDLEQRIVALAWWLHAPLALVDRGCMQRSLLAYRFLGAAGAQPHLAVGVRKEGAAVKAHAWVSIDGAPAGDSQHEIAEFAPMLIFGPDGRKEDFAR
ncbi:MAG TPA: lasso peptide biosynthesis B2 protein [Gemmatimonadaceae bacterium]|nr:lasso peptide biosynthesis B2 protein [Gemmatimonadaceae bacterium]